MGGGSTTTTTNPSQMDYFNAKVASDLAPFMIKNSATGIAGMGPDKASGMQANVQNAVNSAGKMGVAPGSADIMGSLQALATPDMMKTHNLLLSMYGKQPQTGDGGGSSQTNPGAMDYANTALKIANLWEKYKTGQTSPQVDYTAQTQNWNPDLFTGGA